MRTVPSAPGGRDARRAPEPGLNARQPRRIPRALLAVLLSALLLGLAYIALLLATTDAPPAPAASPRPVEASPALRAGSAEELVRMVNQYPGALLAAKEDAGLSLLGAESHDTAWRGGWARVAEAVYADAEGRQLRLLSFYPAGALELLDTAGWLMSPQPGPAVSGCATALLSRAGESRLILRYGDGAYAVLLPQGVSAAQAAAPLQLYSRQEQRE